MLVATTSYFANFKHATLTEMLEIGNAIACDQLNRAQRYGVIQPA